MNLILMRTKVDHLNACWEPHATSTPLKKIPVQSEIKNTSQKQVVEQTDSVNLGKLQNAFNNFDILQDQPAKTKLVDSKRNRKNRLSIYFDPSSSSDEDSGEIKRRPIIKLSSKESSTNVLLRNKERENEEISTVKISPNRNLQKNLSVRNGMKTRKNISTVAKPRNQNDQVQNKKHKAQTETEDLPPDSDEENKICTNHEKKKSLFKKKKSFLKEKVNSVNLSIKDENCRHPSDFNETERKKLKKIPEANQVFLKPKQVKRNTNKNSQAVRNYQKVNTNNNKISKLHKMKGKKIIGTDDFLEGKIKNSDSKNGTTHPFKQMVNTGNPVLENKSNLSHQLFSESTEQEYINILDLTSDEANGDIENMRCSSQRGRNSICQPFNWPYHSDHKVCIENKDKGERPKRKKQTFKKNWYPNDQSTELPVTATEEEVKSVGIFPKIDNQIQNVKPFTNAEKILKGKNPENNYKIKNGYFKNHKDQNETKQEPINGTENETAADDPKSESFKNQLVDNSVLSCSPSSPKMKVGGQENEVCIKNTLKCTQEKSTVDSSVKSVFKQLDELSFNGNGSGCSAVQCWNVKNLKCGVFKLKMKSQFSCQTLHSNSHLGGVLVKGHLRMKIGVKEQDLKEGDMAFVPPLTEWRATNIGECESIFYYWCGRFGD